MSGHAIDGSLKGGRLLGSNPPCRATNSRVDYFFWLNDNIATISVAKAIVTINASNS
jgi:hypothetical protein